MGGIPSHGLGLNICSRIAKELGGNLTLKSVFGDGCMFSLNLNLERVIQA